MALEVNPNLYPKNGFRFKERDGSRWKGRSWADVVKQVTEYRRRRGEEVGDVRAEVMAQACANNPNICVDNSPRQIVTSKAGYASTLFQKVSNWLAQLVQKLQRKQLTLVDRQEAARRAAICAVCPKQLGIPTVCGACISQLSNFRRAILQGQPPVNAGLNGCSALGEDTQISVHLELEPTVNDDMPAACWRRTV